MTRNSHSDRRVQTQKVELIKRNHRLMVRLSRGITNKVLSEDEAYSEFRIRLLEQIEKDETFLDLPINEQDKLAYKILMNYRTDLVRFYSRRPDTSVYTPGVVDGGLDYEGLNDIPVEIDRVEGIFNASKFPSPDEAVLTDSDIEYLLVKVESFEGRFPGISEFVKGLIDPSDEILEKYEDYRGSKNFSRTPEGNYIPPYTFAKLTGITENKLRWYQLVVSRILADSGVPRAENIYDRLRSI